MHVAEDEVEAPTRAPKPRRLTDAALDIFADAIAEASGASALRHEAICRWVSRRALRGLPLDERMISGLLNIDVATIVDEAERFAGKNTAHFVAALEDARRSGERREPIEQAFGSASTILLDGFSGASGLDARISAWLDRRNDSALECISAGHMRLDPERPWMVLVKGNADSARSQPAFERRLSDVLIDDGEWDLACAVEASCRGVDGSSREGGAPKTEEDFYRALFSGRVADVDAFPPDRFRVAVSRDPRLVAEMSTGQRWKSCTTESDSKGATLHADAREGTVVAYLVAAEDTAAAYPFLRIAVRPMRTKHGAVAWFAEGVYGQSDRGLASSASVSGKTAERFREHVCSFVEERLNAGAPAGTYLSFGGIQHERGRLDRKVGWTEEELRDRVRKRLDVDKNHRDRLAAMERSERAGAAPTLAERRLMAQGFKYAVSVSARLHPLLSDAGIPLRCSVERMLRAMADARLTRTDAGFDILPAADARGAMAAAARRLIASENRMAPRKTEWTAFAESVADRLSSLSIKTGDLALALAIAEIRSPGIAVRGEADLRHGAMGTASAEDDRRPASRALSSVAGGVLPEFLDARAAHAADLAAAHVSAAMDTLAKARTRCSGILEKHPSRQECEELRSAEREARLHFDGAFAPSASGPTDAWHTFAEDASKHGLEAAAATLAQTPARYGRLRREGRFSFLGIGDAGEALSKAASAAAAFSAAAPSIRSLAVRLAEAGIPAAEVPAAIVDLFDDSAPPRATAAARRLSILAGLPVEEASPPPFFSFQFRPAPRRLDADLMAAAAAAPDLAVARKHVAEAEEALAAARKDDPEDTGGWPGLTRRECERLSWAADAASFGRELAALRDAVAEREKPGVLGLSIWRELRRDTRGPLPAPAGLLAAVHSELHARKTERALAEHPKSRHLSCAAATKDTDAASR